MNSEQPLVQFKLRPRYVKLLGLYGHLVILFASSTLSTGD